VIFLAQLAALIEQAFKLLFEPVEIFCGLFQGVHAANYSWRGK
jgi:hypothetical protein